MNVEEEIVTLADRLREEGRQEGERTGERKLLLKQLTLRFGGSPCSSRLQFPQRGRVRVRSCAQQPKWKTFTRPDPRGAARPRAGCTRRPPRRRAAPSCEAGRAGTIAR